MSSTPVPQRIRSGQRVAIGSFLAAFGLALSAARGAAATEQPILACVTVTSEARYGGYGYNHIVRIANGCEQPVACVVSTDVNPAAENVTVRPKEVREVVTFWGSPAREFISHVRC